MEYTVIHRNRRDASFNHTPRVRIDVMFTIQAIKSFKHIDIIYIKPNHTALTRYHICNMGESTLIIALHDDSVWIRRVRHDDGMHHIFVNTHSQSSILLHNILNMNYL